MYKQINNNKLISQQKGFTIIEVLIVLSIVGLIMLIVFLAVPQMQKNSRNTQRTADVGRIASVTQEFMVASGIGRLPAASSSLMPGSDAAAILELANTPAVYQLVVASHAATAAQTPVLSEVTLVPRTKCGATSGASSAPIASGAGSQNIAVIYAVEGSSGSTVAKCIDI